LTPKIFYLAQEVAMALSKDQKKQVVDEVADLLSSSKLTVMAKYAGTSVKSMQQLRRDAKDNGTQVRVVKNRLFKKALEANSELAALADESLSGQLLYAFNASDEVAPAQTLAQFAKNEPQIEFVGGITPDGRLLTAEDVKVLASLPGKDQLRAQLVGMISAPSNGFVNVLAGNLRGVIHALNAHAETQS
jgi:large subunit ribosomal protein L10